MIEGSTFMYCKRLVIALFLISWSTLVFAQNTSTPSAPTLDQATFESQWRSLLINLGNCKAGEYSVANFSYYGITQKVAPEIYKISGLNNGKCVVEIQQIAPKEKLDYPLPHIWPLQTGHILCTLPQNALNLLVGYTAKMFSTNLENHSYTTNIVLQGQVFKLCAPK